VRVIAETTPLLAVQDLLVRRGGAAVLTLPHLTLAPGERLAVVGPNGAGKSTLLEVLALLRPPTQGQVWFAGQPVPRHPGELVQLRRRLGVVFQRPLLLSGTLRENVALGLRLRGQSAATAHSAAAAWLDRLGIAHLAGRRAAQVSVGEAQRASLARALAGAPEVLLLDEPFAALDSLARAALLDTLDVVLAEAGCAMVLITHDWREVRRLAEQVVVLFDGRVAQAGAVAAVEARPATPQVAALLAAAQ
jgi:ABC-type sulfate/molybdate transport systems ATPase subunit